ncbi:hypothetical protein ONZ45_g19149 [Pleurotus djamor]|nr:hypothetical protein ONZ45_g19149 [Pleurotus djamor]
MQLPSSNSGNKDGDTWKYTIAYTQDFQMFKNGGNEAFTFAAQYADDINFYKGEQTGIVQGSSAINWSSILQEDHYNDTQNSVPFPFRALSVFRPDSLDLVEFVCKISSNQGDPSVRFISLCHLPSLTIPHAVPD